MKKGKNQMIKFNKKNIQLIIKEIIVPFWMYLILPSFLFMFIFLGALNGIYLYESNLENDLNVSLGIAGSAFYSMYEKGYDSPTMWVIICLVLFVAIFFFIISEIKYIEWDRDETSVTPKE